MANKNNPAGRLYTILEQAVSIGDGVRTEDVWAEIFQIQRDNSAALWHSILELHKLYEDTIESLRSVEDINNSVYIDTLSNIKNTINLLSLDLEWKHYKPALTERVMTTLQFCDDILSRRSIEILVDENELMEILNEVQLLTDDILRGGLDADIKKFLVRQLETIRQAIIDYKLNGSFSLRKAFEDTLGGTLANIEKIKERENIEEFKSYKKLLSKFSMIVKPTYGIAKFAYQESAVILSLPAKLHELYEWFFSPPGSSPPPALPPSI